MKLTNTPFFITHAHASTTNLEAFFTPGKALGPNPTFTSILGPIIQNITILAGLSTFIISLLAGFRFITGAGNPEKQQKASQMLTYSLLGLALAVIAFWITRVLFKVGGLPIF